MAGFSLPRSLIAVGTWAKLKDQKATWQLFFLQTMVSDILSTSYFTGVCSSCVCQSVWSQSMALLTIAWTWDGYGRELNTVEISPAQNLTPNNVTNSNWWRPYPGHFVQWEEAKTRCPSFYKVSALYDEEFKAIVHHSCHLFIHAHFDMMHFGLHSFVICGVDAR